MKYGEILNEVFVGAFSDLLKVKLNVSDRVILTRVQQEVVKELEFGKSRLKELIDSKEATEEEFSKLSNCESTLKKCLPKYIVDKVELSLLQEKALSPLIKEEG